MVDLKCRIAFVVCLLLGLAVAPRSQPFHGLRAKVSGSGPTQQYYAYPVGLAPASVLTDNSSAAAVTMASTALTTPILTSTAITSTLVTTADATTATTASLRHAPITLTNGGVK